MSASRCDPPPAELTTLHVGRAVTGDLQSQGWLVERLSPLLLAQARYRLRGRLATVCDPEDLVQEVWSIALPRLRDLCPRDGRWTPVLLRFLSTTLLRRLNHLVRKHLTGKPRHDDPADAAALPAEVSGVLTRIDRADRGTAVQRALAALPEPQREVLVLRGIEQLSNGEVARRLGLSDSAVTRRYQQALRELRAALPDSVFAELD